MLKKTSLKKKTLAAMLTAVSDHMSMMDRDLNILWANDTAKRLFGDDLVGRKCYEAYHGRNDPCANCCIMNTFEGGDKCQHETQVVDKDGNVLHYHCSASVALRDENGQPTAILEISRNVTEQKRAMEHLKQADRALARRLFLEELMSAASGRFVGLYDMDEAIDETLQDIGTASGASRSYLFIFKANGILMDNTHEWCAPGVPPEKDNLQDLPSSTLPWWMKTLKQERLIHITDVDSLPEEAVAEREILQAQNIKSLIVIPVVIGGELSGFIGFDNVERSGIWNYEDISVLKMVSEIIGRALEYKRAEESLKESEERWRSLVQSAPETVVTLDRKHRICFINRTFRGITPEQILGKDIITLIPDEYQPEALRSLDQVFATGDPAVFECPGMAGIDPSWYQSRIGPIYKDGRVAAVVVVSTNITARKKLEEDLQQDNYMLQQTLFGLSDAAFLLDTEKVTIRDCNKAATKVFGYGREEMLGRNTAFLHVDDTSLGDFRKNLFPAIKKDGYLSGFEFTMKRKDGSVFPSEHGVMPINGIDGKRIGWVSVVRDITDRKRVKSSLERQLWELNFLNETAIEFSSINSMERLKNVICEKLKEFTGAMLTGMSLFDPATNSLHPEHLLSSSATLNTIHKIVGKKIKNMKFPVPPEMLRRMKEQRVERLAGLHELTFGTMPKPVNILVEKTLGIDGVYAILYAEGDNVLGTSMCLLPRGHVPLSLESLKTFAHLATTYLLRIQMEEELSRSEAKFKALYKAIPVPTFTWRRSGDDFELIDYNDEAIHFTGGEIKNFVGLKAGDMYRDRPDIQDDLKQVYETREAIDRDMTYRMKSSGEDRLLSVKCAFSEPDLVTVHSEDITDRTRAEEALRESEEQYRTLFKNTQEGIVETGLDGTVLSINAAGAAMFGFDSPEEAVGKQAADFYADPDQRRELLSDLKESGYIKSREMVMKKSDGSTCYFLVNITTEHNSTGRIQRIISFFADITERKMVEQAIQESEERYRSLVANVPGAVYRCDDKWTMQFISDVVGGISGYPSSDFIDDSVRSFASIMHPEDVPMIEKVAADCLARNVPVEVEYRILHADGGIRWIHDKAQGICDEFGKLLWFDGMVFDITGKKLAAEALRESEEKFKKVVSTSSDAIMVFDAKTRRFLEVNEACEKLYGYSREEFLNKKHSDITAEKKKSDKSILAAAAGKLDHIPLRYHRKKDGTVFPVEISAGHFEYRGRAVLCGVVRDISARLRLEREIVEISSREQQRIGQDLHDGLGQELTGISCMLKALEESLKEKKAEETGEVSRILKLLEQTIAQTHDLARGLHPVDLEDRGLMVALGQMGAKISSLYEINCNYICDADVVIKDPNVSLNLYRIAQEAVTNAVKHSEARNIEILLDFDEEQILLTVQDDGTGIDPIPDESESMGLRIMEYRASQFGGSLSIEPAPDGGTLITCTVPSP